MIQEGEHFDFNAEANPATAELDALRDTVNKMLEDWPAPLEDEDTHAIYAVALCAHLGIPWDARSDLLCARLLALLQGEDLRAHEEAVYMYTTGHWVALSEIPGYRIEALGKARA